MFTNKPRDTELYNVLGVEPTASAEDIKKAYRRQAMRHHPDKGGDAEIFKQLANAYEVLSDPERRQRYDALGQAGLDQGGAPDAAAAAAAHAHNVFNMFFGGNPFGGVSFGGNPFGGVSFGGNPFGGNPFGPGNAGHPPEPDPPSVYPVHVTLEDLYQGKTLQLTLNHEEACLPCQGHGVRGRVQCAPCGGQGAVVQTRVLNPGMMARTQVVCPHCQGQRWTRAHAEPDVPCGDCTGTGKQARQAHYVAAIGPGAPTGHRLQLAPEAPATGPAIVVQVHEIPHEVWRRQGADLHLTRTLTLLEALTGYSCDVLHLDGHVLRLATEPGDPVRPGEVRLVPGLGMPVWGTPQARGQVHVLFEVEYPPPGSPWLTPVQLRQLRTWGGLPLVEADADANADEGNNTYRLHRPATTGGAGASASGNVECRQQ